jgi:hypothetical protein
MSWPARIGVPRIKEIKGAFTCGLVVNWLRTQEKKAHVHQSISREKERREHTTVRDSSQSKKQKLRVHTRRFLWQSTPASYEAAILTARATRRKIFWLLRLQHCWLYLRQLRLTTLGARRHALAQTIGNARGLDINSPLSVKNHLKTCDFVDISKRRS